MSDYSGLALGFLTCLGIFIWFEVSNRSERRKKSKDHASETTTKP